MPRLYMIASSLIFVALPGVLLAGTVPPPPGAAWRGDFENAPLGTGYTANNCAGGAVEGWAGFQIVRPEQLQIVNNPVAEGSKAALLQVQYGDKYSTYSDSRTLMDPCEPQNFVYDGDRRSYRWQVFLPNGFRPDYPKEDELGSDDAHTTARRNGGYNIEWHHAGDRSAPVYLGATHNSSGNYFSLSVNHDPSGNAKEFFQLIPLVTGRWVDWVVEMNFSASSSGWIDIYADSG